MLLKWDIEAQSYGRLNVSKLRISKLACCDASIFSQLTITASVNKKGWNLGSNLNSLSNHKTQIVHEFWSSLVQVLNCPCVTIITNAGLLSKPLNNYSSQKSRNWIKLINKTYIIFILIILRSVKVNKVTHKQFRTWFGCSSR